MNPLLTPDQVAEILGVSRDHVIHLANSKKLKVTKVSPKRWRFTEEAVQEFITKQTSATASDMRKPTHTVKPPTPKKTYTQDEIRKEIDSWL